jgi:hypothetical protein
VKRKKSSPSQRSETVQVDLEQVQVVPLIAMEERRQCQRLLRKHHYLGGLKAIGEQMCYAAVDGQGNWLAVLIFSAAAKHLKHRDNWIGWTRAQRDRRLSLIVNNSRYLILPHAHIPNLGSRVLRLALDRLSADWQQRYGHPVLVVETFVDPDQFDGTVYSAHGWEEVGLTDGWGRRRRDYYVQHDKPKRLFVREVVKNARRSLQAEHLKPALAGVEKRAGARCYYKCGEIKAITEHFKALPEYRDRVESYPIWSLVTLMLLALLCDAPRGQKDLAKLARRLTQHQRRALGIRPNPTGFFPAPSQSTFSRLLSGLNARRLNEVLLAIQAQVRGQPPPDELIAVDGKEPRHGPGDALLTAVSVPSQFYLGSALVDTKTNEIPVARELFGELDLRGRTVALDALHTQDETARQLVMEHGAHYLMTVKNNQLTLRQNIDKRVPLPQRGFSPSAHNANPGADPRKE